MKNENENISGRSTPKSACYNLENNYVDNNNNYNGNNNNDNISDDNNDSGKKNLSSKNKRDRKDEIDLDSVGDRLVVSFRGSVLANVLTDLKFSQVSIPCLKHRKRFFIKMIRGFEAEKEKINQNKKNLKEERERERKVEKEKKGEKMTGEKRDEVDVGNLERKN